MGGRMIQSSSASSYNTSSTCRDTVYYNHQYAILMIILYVVTCSLGIIFNTFTILVVLLRKSMHQSVHFYTTNMAFSDTMILSLFGTFNVHKIFHYNCWRMSLALGRTYFLVAQWSGSISLFTLGALTIDRYRAVKQPFKWRTTAKKHAKIAIFVIWILSFAMALPRFLHTDLTHVNDHVIILVEKTEEGFYYWITVLIILAVLMGMVISLNIHLIYLIYLRKERIRKISQHSYNTAKDVNKRVIRTITGLVVIYVLCIAPSHTYMFLSGMGIHVGSDYVNEKVLFFSDYLLVFQAMLNPLVYGTLAAEYKNALKRILSPLRKKIREFYYKRSLELSANNTDDDEVMSFKELINSTLIEQVQTVKLIRMNPCDENDLL